MDKDKLLFLIKSEIIKINDDLFWASDDSKRQYSKKEIDNIKELLVKSYDYIQKH